MMFYEKEANGCSVTVLQGNSPDDTDLVANLSYLNERFVCLYFTKQISVKVKAEVDSFLDMLNEVITDTQYDWNLFCSAEFKVSSIQEVKEILSIRDSFLSNVTKCF